MKVNAITSATNSLLKKIRSLHERRGREKAGQFFIEGRKAVAEAFEKRLTVREVVVSQSYWKDAGEIPGHADSTCLYVVDDKLFKDLPTTVTPEGIVAVADLPEHKLEDMLNGSSAPLVVIAHAIQDPGNAGTLIRSALAANCSGLVLTKGSVDPYNPKVVRSAMGALFALPVMFDVTLEELTVELKHHGLRILACQQGAPTHYFDADLTKPIAIMLGNEAQGLSEADLSQADATISIPMNERSESLNVAVSGSIVLFSAVEQRLKALKRNAIR